MSDKMDYLDKEFLNLSLSGNEMQTGGFNCIPKKTGPMVPPKPMKKEAIPEVPQSRNVKQTCKPLYSQRLQYGNDPDNGSSEEVIQKTDIITGRQPLLQRKKQSFNMLGNYDSSLNKVTLDNPAVLDQQLEVLAHHKRQLERKGLLPNSSIGCVPKLSTTSLAKSASGETDNFYANILQNKNQEVGPSYSNVKAQRNFFETINAHNNSGDTIYSNLNSLETSSCLDPQEDDIQAPASPVSSSYSELRRATDVFAANKDIAQGIKDIPPNEAIAQSYMNVKYNNGGNEIGNFSCYSPTLQNSSTYESIYEPINPRPPSQLSSGSNYLSYSPYINTSMHSQLADRSIMSNSSSLNLSSLDTSHDNLSTYSSNVGDNVGHLKPEAEVEALTGYLVHSMENESDVDNFGICFKCNERVLGETSGCTAMNQIYHIHCFTCAQCQINLQGKPFYALENKPYCEYDYLQTLEKCSVCMKPILERILRATGKPYHPQCFTCVVCKKSLDGIPFTVDATNQNYCIEDFHKKFAPRCCVCKEPIMPEPGEEETVRVVALDRSFHFECYKCEDCGLLLSSEAEGRGCYPLDDHVLCKSCNAQRVQLLTNRITTEL